MAWDGTTAFQRCIRARTSLRTLVPRQRVYFASDLKIVSAKKFWTLAWSRSISK